MTLLEKIKRYFHRVYREEAHRYRVCAICHPERDGDPRLSEELWLLVREHMGWDTYKTMLWFKTPNPCLGGSSPNRLIEMDRGHKVKQFILAAIEESQPPLVEKDLAKLSETLKTTPLKNKDNT